MTPGKILVDGRQVYYIHNNVQKTPSIVLLHGKNTNANAWVVNGTMDYLAKNGYSAISLNLPGYYPSYDMDLLPHVWMLEVLNTMKIPSVVLVSPTLSGEYSLPFMMKYPKRVTGFVGVTTNHMDQFKGGFKHVNVPVLMFWGEKDVVDPILGHLLVSTVKNGEFKLINGMDHNEYLAKSEEFNGFLVDFMKKNNI